MTQHLLKVSFLIAKSISSYVLPTPEKTIFLDLILDFKANINSPLDTTSAPNPNFEISFKILILLFALTAKHISGLIF